MSYDAVVFDLLTALLESATLWNDVAGTAEDGLKWRRRYLEITYGCPAGPARRRSSGRTLRGGHHNRKRWLLRTAAGALSCRAGCAGNGTRADVVRGRFGFRRARRPVYCHNRIGPPLRDDIRPDRPEKTLGPLKDLF